MAERLTHRDLRNRSAEVLRNVEAGHTYEITNHGRVVAVLSPPRLAGGLSVRPARLPRNFSDLPRVRRSESVLDVLDDLRGTR